MAYRRSYSGPPYPTTDSMIRGVPMYSNNSKMVGQWHPTVLYLIGLILVEIMAVAVIRNFPMPLGK